MLRFFRRNLFINYIFLLLFVVILQAYFLFNWTPAKLELSLNISIDVLPLIVNNHFLQSFLSVILILAQAMLLSRYIIVNRLSRVLSIVSGAVFVLFASLVLQDLSFDFILVANLFFILSIGSLYNIYKKHQPVTNIFNAGFYLSLATLVYYPYIAFTIVLIIGLIILRSLKVVEFLQMIIGYLSGFFLVGILLYYFGKLDLLWEMFGLNFGIPRIGFSNPAEYIKPGLVLIVIGVIFINQNILRKKKNYEALRKLELSYWMLFAGLLSIFFINDIEVKHLLILSFPISMLSGLILEQHDNKLTKEFIFLLGIGLYFILVFKLI